MRIECCPLRSPCKRFQTIPRRDPQIVQGDGSVEKAKLDQGPVRDLRRQPSRSDTALHKPRGKTCPASSRSSSPASSRPAISISATISARSEVRALQDSSDCIYCVVDLHSITAGRLVPRPEPPDPRSPRPSSPPASIRRSTSSSTRAACVQHAELAWIFNCVARIGWMNRMTQFKDKAGKDRENASLGLLAYPSADGRRHPRLPRHPRAGRRRPEAAPRTDPRHRQKFNNDFSERIAELGLGVEMQVGDETVNGYFPITEPVIGGPATRVMSLRDGSKKMSKSDPSDLSRINLTDDADTISKKIRKAKTDPDGCRPSRRAEGPAGGGQSRRHLCRARRQDEGAGAAEFGGQQFSSSSRRWPIWPSTSWRRSPARCGASRPTRPMSTASCRTAANGPARWPRRR
jgi:tryptophanyl-tRNA synthetase